MKRLHLFGIGLGSAALMMSGAVLAGPPSGHAYNDWTALGGIITKNSCNPPECVVLLSEQGMLQARVREDNDPNGQGYFQTINTMDGFTGAPAAAEFRNESFVESSNGTFSVAALSFVDLSGEGLMQVELSDGNLQDTGNNEAAMIIYQTNVQAGFGQLDFSFEKQQMGAQFSTATNSGGSLRIDQTYTNITGNRSTPLTVRQTSGFYTADSGTLELVDGTTITYAQGQHIGTVFSTGLLWHLGPMHAPDNTSRVFELQSIANFTTAERANWTNVNNQIDDTGLGYVNFPAVWTDEYALNSNLWNANFGTVPNTVPSGTADFTATQANAFPDFPVHDDHL